MGEFHPGERALFVRNDSYWAADQVYLDAIETFSIPDSVARLNALLAGEIHFAVGVDIKSLPLLEKSAAARPVLARSGTGGADGHDVRSRADQRPRFRMALKLLQDRQKVVDGIYKGHAQIGNDHEVAPNDPVYAADIPIRAYDPPQARFHLKKAGLENTGVDLYTSPVQGPARVEQALLLLQTAAPAGVQINIKQVPADGYWNATWMKHALCSSAMERAREFGQPLEHLPFQQLVLNETVFKSDRLDQLLVAARSELDDAKRRQHWHDLQLLVHDEGGNLTSAFPDYLHGRSIALNGDVLSHPMAHRGRYLSGEWIWLAAS